MERTPFAIDDAKDEDEDSDGELDEGDNDDEVLDEVRVKTLPHLFASITKRIPAH